LSRLAKRQSALAVRSDRQGARGERLEVCEYPPSCFFPFAPSLVPRTSSLACSTKASRSSIVSTSRQVGNSAVFNPSASAFVLVREKTRSVDQGIPVNRSGIGRLSPIR